MEQKIYLRGSDALIADAEVTSVLLDMHTGKSLPVNTATVDFWPDLAELIYLPEGPAKKNLKMGVKDFGSFRSQTAMDNSQKSHEHPKHKKR
jgi:hypothetical protein